MSEVPLCDFVAIRVASVVFLLVFCCGTRGRGQWFRGGVLGGFHAVEYGVWDSVCSVWCAGFDG